LGERAGIKTTKQRFSKIQTLIGKNWTEKYTNTISHYKQNKQKQKRVQKVGIKIKV